MTAGPSDEQLAQRALAGEEAAFDELVRRHQSRVYHLAYVMCRDRDLADDWAQEAFVRAFEQLRHFDSTRPFTPWLLKVATNVCLNQVRRGSLTTVSLEATDNPEDEPRQIADEALTPPMRLEQRELTECVQAALAELPEKYRVVMVLRHLEDLEYDEIAAATGLPLGTVKTFLHRGRERLRHLLAIRLGES